METLKKLKQEYDKLNGRGKTLVIMGLLLAVIIIVELVK